ncbi:AAA family ATPase [Actimicrobium sp. CCI2.3]|uniref:AAA family ATPase n=1 Tax=Actimicrobium sp. CCI2.3 TaxID=3048616 RepID=UPI002AB412EE|nr:AAA family ATPase [Actimicrobium sp. CCI2.3]MDY7576234.1 AAA family ATPase [Actimicrobium sp. CCI2.3]MEB0020562.1 AAA family ATPase [Actimicrobium sp. CCI2.3]
MLTRLRVRGFKSLEDVEVRFGPFTCIAGVNGVGKSNLFDAILFLKNLSNMSIIEAANSIRNSGKQRTSISSLFTRTSTGQADLMVFEADMLVAGKVIDDFSREAKPKVTFLRYTLGFQYIPTTAGNPDGIELVNETLDSIPKGLAKEEFGFDISTDFFESVYLGTSRNNFIYTEIESKIVKIRQDQTQGAPIAIPISKADRTVLSNINTIERPTALAARREMQSWTLLQLESSSLRKPDDFSSKDRVSENGEHLPATLHRLQKNQEIANQLSNLLPEVKNVFVDIDEKRQLKTLYLETVNQIRHEARALSDGTLRFLALAIIGADAYAGNLICLEEPENGIHPARIPAIVDLLYQMAVDTKERICDDNPLRQIIINTHSPLVVQHIAAEDIIVSQAYYKGGAALSVFKSVENTWRSKNSTLPPVGFGVLMDYLNNPANGVENIHGKQSLTNIYKIQLDLLAQQ